MEEIELRSEVPEFKTQLLKWVGNKQRFANEIIRYFPSEFNCFYEPFLVVVLYLLH